MNVPEPLMLRTSAARKHTVVVCDSGAGGCEAISAALAMSDDFRAQVIPVDALTHHSGPHEPDVVILDIKGEAGNELDHLTAIRARFTDTPIIIVSKGADDSIVRGLLRHRVQDWQRHPLSPGDLLAALNASIRTNRASASRVHAVISASAGSGGTTVAVSLADIMARKLPRGNGSVGLFDLDFSSGDCGMRLNLSTTARLESAITTPTRIDAEFVGLIQQKHPAGINLYSFKRREFITHLNTYEMVLRLLDAVTLEHSHTVLDIPAYQTDWEAEVLSAVNTITVVCEMNVVSIRHALDILKTIEGLPGGPKLVTVAVNKVERGLFGRQRIPKSRLKDLFGDTRLIQLPADGATLLDSIDRGLLPREVSARSPFLKALEKHAAATLLTDADRRG